MWSLFVSKIEEVVDKWQDTAVEVIVVGVVVVYDESLEENRQMSSGDDNVSSFSWGNGDGGCGSGENQMSYWWQYSS